MPTALPEAPVKPIPAIPALLPGLFYCSRCTCFRRASISSPLFLDGSVIAIVPAAIPAIPPPVPPVVSNVNQQSPISPDHGKQPPPSAGPKENLPADTTENLPDAKAPDADTGGAGRLPGAKPAAAKEEHDQRPWKSEKPEPDKQPAEPVRKDQAQQLQGPLQNRTDTEQRP